MSNNPFVAGARIEDVHLFYGYKEELNTLTQAMIAVQPTSINMYGEKRIGKSSLLYHFYLTWRERIAPNRYNNFAVIYLSMKEARCYSESIFYQSFAQELSALPVFQKTDELRTIWQGNEWTREKFTESIKLCKRFNVLPVLCLDDVEKALKNQKAFDEGFYDNLRSLMDSNALMLVIATFEPVIRYKKKYNMSSTFFNVGHNVPLTGFTEQAVENLVKSIGSALPEQTQTLIRQWGGKNPYRLQLAGHYLFKADQLGKDEKWAKQKFDEQLDFIKSSSQSEFWRKLGDFLSTLGGIGETLGNLLNNVRMMIIGAIALTLIVLSLVGYIPGEKLVIALMSVFAIASIFNQN